MESSTGRSRAAACASACAVHCCQCTGLSACWRKYGLVASPRVFVADESAGLIVASRRPLRSVGLVGDLPEGVGALVGGLIGFGVRGVERFGHLFQLLVHRA